MNSKIEKKKEKKKGKKKERNKVSKGRNENSKLKKSKTLEKNHIILNQCVKINEKNKKFNKNIYD